MVDRVRDEQLLPVPDAFRHQVFGDATKCLCGPQVDHNGRERLITHHALMPKLVRRWIRLMPGMSVSWKGDEPTQD